MSRTVNDLVEAIRHDEELTFDADAVWLNSQRRARQLTIHRRLGVTALACAAVAAVIAAPSFLLAPRSANPGPAVSGTAAESTTPSPDPTPTTEASVPPTRLRAALSTTLRATNAGGWIIAPALTGPQMQLAYFRRVSQTKTSGSVEVYEPGVFDAGQMLAGTETTVDDRPAYYGVTADPFSGDENGERRNMLSTLAWEYAPDAWVVVRYNEVDESGEPIPPGLREVAATVEIGEPVPVQLPFQVGYRPAGMVPAYVRHYEAAAVNRYVYYEYANAPIDFLEPGREFRLPLQISMQPAMPQFWQPDTTIGGRPAMRNGPNLVVVADGDQWITIGSGPQAAPLPDAEIEQILAGLTLATWTDQTTWFDANSAA
jgi:hypothetical protein